MRRFLIRQIALRDLPVMLGVATIGAIVAGVYGMLHDQVTFTISPEGTQCVYRGMAWEDWQLLTRKNLREELWVDAKGQRDSSLLVSSRGRYPFGKEQHYRLSLPELEGVKIERAPILDNVSPDGHLRVDVSASSW